MTREKLIEQAQGINKALPYVTLDSLLVKPLNQEFVERTVIKQLDHETLSDKDYKANPEDDDLPEGYERKIETGPSMYRNGIVVGLPKMPMPEHLSSIQVGSIVTFMNSFATPLDLMQDMLMVPATRCVCEFVGNLTRLSDFQEKEETDDDANG